jgi:hypothetical protein
MAAAFENKEGGIFIFNFTEKNLNKTSLFWADVWAGALKVEAAQEKRRNRR